MRRLGLVGLVMILGSGGLACAGMIDWEPPRANLALPIEDGLLWRLQGGNPGTPRPSDAARELRTLDELYAALGDCFEWPPLDLARPGMRVTVQFTYTRDGELFGKPRILYETPGATPEQLSAYRSAAAAALARCTPLPFSKSLGSAVAGRVLSIQFVERRNLRGAELTPWPIPTTR